MPTPYAAPSPSRGHCSSLSRRRVGTFPGGRCPLGVAGGCGSGVVVLVGGDVPQARTPLGVELLLRRRTGRVAVLLRLALLVAGRTRGLGQAQVGAARAEQLGAGLKRRLPVEDDRVVGGPDDDGVAGDRADLVELVLDAEPAETVGEVADGLVVAEVGLANPAHGTGASNAEEDAVGS